MRSSRALPFLALAASLLVPAAALAQDDDYDYSGESEELELQGFASASYAHSFQDTDLPGGGSFDDGNGFELTAGFQAGDYVVFTGGWEWQRHSDYTTHYFPVTVRGLSPSIAERVNLFGEASIGVFFSRLRNQFDNPEDDNERGSAVRLRAGTLHSREGQLRRPPPAPVRVHDLVNENLYA